MERRKPSCNTRCPSHRLAGESADHHATLPWRFQSHTFHVATTTGTAVAGSECDTGAQDAEPIKNFPSAFLNWMDGQMGGWADRGTETDP